MSESKKGKIFAPKNRRLLIDRPSQSEKTEAGVLLPEEYTKDQNKHTVARVLSVASDCNLFNQFQKNFYVVVDTHMIETVKVFGDSYDTVMENYVIGTLEP